METEHKGLGRKLAPDSRDTRYPMQATVEHAEPFDRAWRYWWLHGAWLDQGMTGTCVGHAWAHYVEDGPLTWRGTIDPFEIYREAALLDVWPENDNGDLNFGTSVRAGAKALQARGRITEYRWAWDIDTVVDALLRVGPVVVGSWWYSGMWEPDERGFIEVSGVPEGGHAYLLNGINIDRDLVRIKNSWGRSWGRSSYKPNNAGYAFIRIADMERLIKEDGEACLAVEATS